MVGSFWAAIALVLAPTAVHASSPIGSLDLNGLGPTTVGVLKGPASVTMKVYGSDMNLSCSSGSLTGSYNTATPTTSPLTLNSVVLHCDSFYPGTTVTVEFMCPLPFNPATGSKVTALQTDVVTGTVNAGANCVKVTRTGGCTMYFNGATGATLDENVTVSGGVSYNELSLMGTGFTVASSPAPTFGCLGAISGGSRVVINSFNFDLSGSINFLP